MAPATTVVCWLACFFSKRASCLAVSARSSAVNSRLASWAARGWASFSSAVTIVAKVASPAAARSAVPVQAAALTALGTLQEKRYAALFAKALESKSYRVQAAALQGLLPLNPAQALARATAFEADNKGALTAALVAVYGQAGSPAQWPLMLAKYDAANPEGRFGMLPGIAELLGRVDDSTALREGIARIRDLTVEFKRFVDAPRLVGMLREVQAQQATRPNAALAKTLVDEAAAAIEAAK